MRKTIHWFILFAGLAEVQGWSNLSLWTKSSLAVPRNGRQTKQDHSLTLSDQRQQERRSFLETLWTTSLVTTTATAILPSSSQAAGTLTLDPKGISTVVLNSPKDRLGVELADISLVGQQSYPYVKSISDPKGQAAQQGITSPGFIVLQGTTASGVVQRIQQGPYPVVLQLYNLAYESDASSTQTPLQALQQYTSTSSPRILQESDGPPVSPKGAGLKVQTIQRPSSRLSCNQNTVVQRGSTITIAYEARVASPGGPIYDASPEMTLRMGQRGQQQSTILVPGVESGLLGMCVEEVRTLDIPSALGYGRRGSEEYYVPGDVRLWWKVTLLGVDNSNR